MLPEMRVHSFLDQVDLVSHYVLASVLFQDFDESTVVATSGM
jgi:hypothetical protein